MFIYPGWSIIVHWVVAMKRLKFVDTLDIGWECAKRYIEWIRCTFILRCVRVLLVKRSLAQNANCFFSLSLWIFSCACWISRSLSIVLFVWLFSFFVYIYCLFAFFSLVIYKRCCSCCCYCCHGCFYFCSWFFCCCSWWLFVCMYIVYAMLCCFSLYLSCLPLHCLNLNKFICRSCKKGPLKNKSNKYLWKCLESQSTWMREREPHWL